MRAWRSDFRVRTASSSIDPRRFIFLPLVALLVLVGLGASRAEGATASRKPDSTSRDESGFQVRVVEQSKGARTRLPATTPDAPTPPDVPLPPDSIDFDRDSGANDLVRFGEDVEIAADKVIEGDVVAIGGDVTVYGRVRGDVVSIGGAVEVRGGGAIEGDAVSIGGGVSTSDSGSVGGSNVSVGTMRFGRHWGLLPALGMFGAIGFGAWAFSTLVQLILTLFFAWLALLLWRDGIVRAADRMRDQFGKSFLWGLLMMAALVLAIPVGIVSLVLLDLIAVVILCITIIGIPLAILLLIALVFAIIGLVVGVIFAIFLGYLNGALYLGRRLLGARAESAHPLVVIAAGLVLIALLGLAGKLAGLVGFILFHPLSIAFGIAASALSFVLTAAGLGALWLTLIQGGGLIRRVRSYNWGPLRPRPSPSATGTPAAPESAPGAGPGYPPPAPSPVAPPEGGTSDAP